MQEMQEMYIWSLGREDPLEKEMVTHSSILAWRIPWTEEPGGLQSTGSQRVGHDWATSLHFSLLAILWNSAFKWVYLSFSPLPFTSFLFSAICKDSSDNHFAFLHFFFLGMVLIAASCTMPQTSVHSSSGTLELKCLIRSIRSNPLNLFVTSTV